MAVDPLTAKILAKVAVQAATDSESRKRILFMILAPEVKMYGQALLDIPCYKILMGCDGKNLQETKDLYNLTDAEQELLESKRRGHALFIIGSKRLHVNFEIPAYKFSYMGKAGGR